MSASSIACCGRPFSVLMRNPISRTSCAFSRGLRFLPTTKDFLTLSNPTELLPPPNSPCSHLWVKHALQKIALTHSFFHLWLLQCEQYHSAVLLNWAHLLSGVQSLSLNCFDFLSSYWSFHDDAENMACCRSPPMQPHPSQPWCMIQIASC